MKFIGILLLFIAIGFAVYFVLKLGIEERAVYKEEKAAKKKDTVLGRADINLDNIDDALEKAKGNDILLDEIKKELLNKLATANKKGNTELVRKYNSSLKKLNDYMD